MKNLKKAASLILTAATMTTALCGTMPVSAAEVQHHKIGVGLYVDSGRSVDAIKEYLAGISEAVD